MTLESQATLPDDSLETQPLLSNASHSSSIYQPTLVNQHDGREGLSSSLHEPMAPLSFSSSIPVLPSSSNYTHRTMNVTTTLPYRKTYPAWLIFLATSALLLSALLFGAVFMYPSFFTITLWKTKLDDSMPNPLRLQLIPPRINIYTISEVDLYNPLIFPLNSFQFKVKAYSPRFVPPLYLGESTQWVELHLPARATSTVHVPMLMSLNSSTQTPLIHVVMKFIEECQQQGGLMVDTYVNITLSKTKMFNELAYSTYRRMHVPCHLD
ncbi:hypothetical protein HMI54_010195 [Coelomomyces lativittatus]|nr:hypothetical protein HMI54_010195 [Coelomomyces lativittatus]KAJ1501729.1 hypothetical protein HMI55_003246 [Coelomomyces lativittatus]KAJ1510629.1 hypothetical protein HMI56_006247 [Coelomomyces lativittatus]